ncbi:GNAT family N-acetyltransferase [Pseudalkalibacillus hwajinpoensis]|uniref:GNAT family N-acetyltransferase n=1 Tax=Guptibacillus hwajinpoensis TaxID=208199 RepID=UPI00325C166E
MYIRNRIKEKDDSTLVSICTQNFEIPSSKIENILNQAHEVLIVCEPNGKIAGFLSYRLRINHMVLVDYVVLDHSVQGKGIARKLLPAFESYVMKQGITTVYGMVDKENQQGIESFKRLGFETKGSFLTNYIIEKKLDQVKEITSNNLHLNVRKLSPVPKLGNR